MKNAILLIAGGAGLAYIMFSKKTPVIQTIPQKTKAPQTAVAQRTDQGNAANQPWYSGPAQVAQGISINEILSGIKNIGSIFDSFGGSRDVPTYDFSIANDDTQYFEWAGAGAENMTSDPSDYLDPSFENQGLGGLDNGELAYA